MKGILELATTVFAFCVGGFILWHFSQIVQRGTFLIAEPNLWILYSEIVACGIFILIAVLNFVLLIKGKKGSND